MRFWLTLFLFIGTFSVYADVIDNIDTIAPKIEAKLKVGAPREVIEEFLNNSLWPYSYDKYQHRYQAIIPDKTYECINRNFLLWLFYDCGIQVYFNIDKSGYYSGYQLEQIYSGL